MGEIYYQIKTKQVVNISDMSLAEVQAALREVYTRSPVEDERTVQFTDGTSLVRGLSNGVRDEWRRKTYAALKRREAELLVGHTENQQ